MVDPVAPAQRREAGRGNRHWLFVSVAAAAVLAVVVVYAQSGQPNEVAQPLPQPATPAPLDLADPFGGTPAAAWADGADGIRLPTAKAVGPYTAAQVAEALTEVRTALVAGHLDPTMLTGHDDRAYLAALAPAARKAEAATLAAPATRDDSGGVSLLAPGATLLPVPVKVDGNTSVELGSNGALLVHTNYVFAFPFRPAEPDRITDPAQIVALQHVTEDFQVPLGHRFSTAEHGVWPAKVDGYYDQISCTASRQGYLAPQSSDLAANPAPATGDPAALYDPGHAVDIKGTCPA